MVVIRRIVTINKRDNEKTDFEETGFGREGQNLRNCRENVVLGGI